MSHRQTHPSVSSSLEHAVDKYLAESMATDQIPGLSLAVSHAGALLLSKGYGWANVELRVPATAETVYEIASITKLFTATAIMMLAEEGNVDLRGMCRDILALCRAEKGKEHVNRNRL